VSIIFYIKQMSNKLACSSIYHRKASSIDDTHERHGNPGKNTTQDIIMRLNLDVKP